MYYNMPQAMILVFVVRSIALYQPQPHLIPTLTYLYKSYAIVIVIVVVVVGVIGKMDIIGMSITGTILVTVIISVLVAFISGPPSPTPSTERPRSLRTAGGHVIVSGLKRGGGSELDLRQRTILGGPWDLVTA